jgi:hypothetical protein
MSSKVTIKSRSIHIKLSVRTYNDLGNVLRDVQEGRISKQAQRQAALLRERLGRAPQLRAK